MTAPTIHRLHVIACGVLALDLKHVAQGLGLDVSMEFLPGGLHSTPKELRRRLQEAIDEASAAQKGDMIAIAYGICGLGTVGLHARNVPLAVPRINDCIALFLGSDAAYREQFRQYPGTYYISAGWVEENSAPLGQSADDDEDSAERDEEFERLVAEHGRENADAVRYFLNSWQRNYQRAAFIDTGAPGRRERYAGIAQRMAEGYGWEYEELSGTGELLEKLLRQRHTDSDILIVPPHHVTDYDPAGKTLTARPVWQESEDRQTTHSFVSTAPAVPADASGEDHPVRTGLGIDAGGTYTDVVLYDFQAGTVVEKAKSLTTKWDYTLGINGAMDKLGSPRLGKVDLVAVSTTLATNAIVEGRGQAVGLLIMPPYGLYDEGDIPHRPLAVIDGQLEISGEQRCGIDGDQVRRVGRAMIDRHGIGAFAVAGFASHDNPEHEQQVKAILRAEFGLPVTCGHEVSETLNYRVRAVTAALNARIIPCLEALLEHVQESMERRGVTAPCMVVCSNGSLMSVPMAHEKPIETILSGPAASVAGASLLSGRRDALVVDMGGTTTDTAVIRDGQVRTCKEGASVGGWRTHVQALDLRTLGLGGDSLIAWERRKLQIGPRRVAPVAFALAEANGHESLDWIERNLDYFDDGTGGMSLISLNGSCEHLDLVGEDRRIVDLLGERPRSLEELAMCTGSVAWQFVPLSRLEEQHAIQRAGLTPTDMLHATGKVALWDTDAARRICELTARLFDVTPDELAEQVLDQVVRRLAVALLKKQLAEEIDADELEDSPSAMAMVENLLNGGNGEYRVRVQLKRPVIGIGAPVHFFLPQAAAMFETECVIPPNADVANAIGAITSTVRVHRRAEIAPNEYGTYSVHGLPGNPTFTELDRASEYASDELAKLVRELAHQAGTSQTEVEVTVSDHVAEMAEEGRLFVGRMVDARLIGRPDIARLVVKA
ncbi:MAG: hydantoinase/oxoprolinase family protein [Planctomycetota bacterium]|jgi:N-methylhydantoinase A/oxoprolinase/acetone carboxylase beta subunit